jgi:hypothetical protein
MGFTTHFFQFENQTRIYQNKWITMMFSSITNQNINIFGQSNHSYVH